MLNKEECKKDINNSLEKILDQIIEVLDNLKTKNSTKLEEMQALVFSKRKIIDITENIQKILQNIAILRIIHRNMHLTYTNKKPEFGFDYLNEVFSIEINEEKDQE